MAILRGCWKFLEETARRSSKEEVEEENAGSSSQAFCVDLGTGQGIRLEFHADPVSDSCVSIFLLILRSSNDILIGRVDSYHCLELHGTCMALAWHSL